MAGTEQMKSEEKMREDYESLRRDLATFWKYRPRQKSFHGAFPGTVKELTRRVEFYEEILQIPEDERFDYEEYDQNEIK